MDPGEIKEVFDAYAEGQGKDKTVPIDRLGEVLRSCGAAPTQREINQAAQQINRGGSFDMNGLTQIAQHFARPPQQEQQDLIQALRLFDDGSGSISVQEYREIMGTAGGDGLNPQEMNEAMALCPPDGSGRISIQALAQAMAVQPFPQRQ